MEYRTSWLNVQETLQAPEPQLSKNLREIFKRLPGPEEDIGFVESYVVSICRKLQAEAPSPLAREAKTSFGPFSQACLTAGIVQTMMAVARIGLSLDSQEEEYISHCYAMDSLCYLLKSGDESEKESLVEQLLPEGFVAICLRNMGHDLCLLRQVGVDNLRTLVEGIRLEDRPSSAVVAGIMERACLFILRSPKDPQYSIAQLLGPTTSWQIQVFAARQNLPKYEAKKSYPRTHGIGEVSAILMAHLLLCTSPHRSRKFCLEILKQSPQIIDLLLDCMILERTPWHPSSQVDTLAGETLVLLFQWPSHVVPGLSNPTYKSFKASDWKAMLQAVSIFMSREDWSERLIEAWMRIQEEDIKKSMRFFYTAGTDYDPVHPPTAEMVDVLFENRGKARITVLRVLTTLTHAAESCGITNAQIESFLQVAYHASRKCKSPPECLDAVDKALTMENIEEITRNPRLENNPFNIIELPITISPENVLGPTALIRLLAVLAQRKALAGIQTLRHAPPGLSPSTSLSQIQMITHPDVIRRTIKITQERLKYRMQMIQENLTRKKGTWAYHIVCAAFTGCAELAAALISLDTHTEGTYTTEIRGARRQLVIALGNASQMSLNVKQYEQAFHFAWGAVSAAENIPEEEGLDKKLVEKNQQRISQATFGLERLQQSH
ncbi:hypothetical protein CONPUDRAFT_146150 [Coniophora puteana RWD-64-598 SS2]|uniref:Uncharacterized protein n=1 Tax=Coniophora puteana (strain RWD-64-598) TaxID=741705 RepID=A0A5M3MDT2_CONPW|nr:uncharacterized protein CONPUDRAFT_146150 [Coniophora puteana RWD-64-598 SS2]EIW77040.1 hypothetical protein CONPUDRAFT_146150 [Coniophora puteana RWD-64-598 SS2]